MVDIAHCIEYIDSVINIAKDVRRAIGLSKNFVHAILYNIIEKPKWNFWLNQYNSLIILLSW